MDVAAATSTVSRPFNFMTPRGGDAVDHGAATRTPPEAQGGTTASEPLVNRFPSIAFSYDTDASRLVMLYRDPASGKTVSQIPTESALKQYKEAQQQEKNAERAVLLKLTVDGASAGGSQTGLSGGGSSNGGTASVSGRGVGAHAAPQTTTHAASVAVAASVSRATVAHSPLSAAASAGSSAERVNVVI